MNFDSNSANPLWGSDWHKVRQSWRLDNKVFYFNHGGYGAVPTVVREHQAILRDRIDSNPTRFFRRDIDPLLEAARLEAAAYCGASPEGFAWVRNATEGMTVAIAAIPLQEGHEVLITNHIYPAVRLLVENKCLATGAKLVEVAIPFTDNDAQLISLIEAAISKKTGLIVVDEIASATARIFPIRDLARIARSHQIPIVVDGAHAPGMYELSVDSLGADIWVGNFHKWACAPHGAAALWAAPQWRDSLKPPSVSNRDRLVYPQQFGRLGTDDLTAVLCVPTAVNFLKSIGAQNIYRYIRELSAYGAGVIGQALGTEMVKGRFAGRHPVALPPRIAADSAGAMSLLSKLALELHAEVPVSSAIGPQDHGALVISAFAYNHPAEYEEFARLLQRFLRNFKS